MECLKSRLGSPVQDCSPRSSGCPYVYWGTVVLQPNLRVLANQDGTYIIVLGPPVCRLVGGLEHDFVFFHRLGISSSRSDSFTNQLQELFQSTNQQVSSKHTGAARRSVPRTAARPSFRNDLRLADVGDAAAGVPAAGWT